MLPYYTLKLSPISFLLRTVCANQTQNCCLQRDSDFLRLCSAHRSIRDPLQLKTCVLLPRLRPDFDRPRPGGSRFMTWKISSPCAPGFNPSRLSSHTSERSLPSKTHGLVGSACSWTTSPGTLASCLRTYPPRCPTSSRILNYLNS
jgi:hypothetical protein